MTCDWINGEHSSQACSTGPRWKATCFGVWHTIFFSKQNETSFIRDQCGHLADDGSPFDKIASQQMFFNYQVVSNGMRLSVASSRSASENLMGKILLTKKLTTFLKAFRVFVYLNIYSIPNVMWDKLLQIAKIFYLNSKIFWKILVFYHLQQSF